MIDGDGDQPDCLFPYGLNGKCHRGRANFVFCDAHVKSGKTGNWAQDCITRLFDCAGTTTIKSTRPCLAALK
jgi:prepilin-type processing-associated H-X9-DG protein